MGAYSGAVGPSQGRKVLAGGLEHHVLEWAPNAPDPEQTTVFLLHGFMDVADSWQGVAPALADAGLRVLAPDLRGFGDGPRAPAGSYYYFADYVADLGALADELARDRALFIVGHSMGGVVATLFAGTFPARVAKLAVLEGLGPPDSTFGDAPDRMRDFIETSRKYRRSVDAERGMVDLDDVVRRLSMSHPSIAPEVLRAWAPSLVRARPDGSLVWRFDSLHRARSPFPFYASAFRAFAERIVCPTLFVDGGPDGYHPHDEDERLAAFRDLRRERIEKAGHMMHWTRPDALSALLVSFLAAT
jgi:pimeloyl-ACP methyl ester carboxylesterase